MARVGTWLKRIVIVIVVAIVALIAYYKISDKVTGPPAQASNVSDLRSLNTALHTYQVKYGHYPDALTDLGVAASSGEHGAGLIGSKLASGRVHGYRYSYSKTRQGYEVHADPDGADNNMHLFTDESSEIRFQRKKPADRSSSALQ